MRLGKRRADKGIELLGSKPWRCDSCLPELLGTSVARFAQADAVLFDIAPIWHCGAVRDVVRVQLRVGNATDPAAVAIASEDGLTKSGTNRLFTTLAHASLSPK